MKKILHIAPTPFFSDRGCHIRIEGIVRCLDELGYQNTVCTYHHGRDISSVNTRRISPIKNYTQTAAGPSKYKLLADWKLLWLVFDEFRRSKPQAIHAHLHEGLFIASIIRLMFFWRGTPLIADMQGSLTGELESHGAFKSSKWLKSLTHFFEGILMRLPTAIVCSSRHSLEKLREEFDIREEKISLAQDGADPFERGMPAQQRHLREQYGLPEDKVVAVYSGALLASKGLAELKQLIVDCQEQNIHFLIIGYPTDELQSFLLDNDLQGSCTLTGQIDFDKLPALLDCCDIAIDPKNSNAGEGSGKMLNYLACGLPVVAFDTANNREFLPAGTDLAKNGNELAQRLQLLAADNSKRDSESRHALQHFTRNYSWKTTRAQLQAVYQRTLVSNFE